MMRRARVTRWKLVVVAFCALVGAGCAHDDASKGTLGDPVTLRRDLARVLVDHRAWDQAVAPLRQAIELRPADAESHALLGIVYRERGLLAAAADELERAVALDPRAASPLSDLGIVHDLAGRHDEALVAHRRAVALAPKEYAWRNNLGYSLILAGRYDEAKVELGEALRADPSSRRGRTNLALACGRAGDLDGAARELGRAGTPAQTQNNLGLIREARGDSLGACEAYDAALAIDPRLTEARANRARACTARPVTHVESGERP